MTNRFNIIDDVPRKSGGKYVSPGRYAVGYGSLWTDRLNGGLVLTLCDPKRQIGALAHITDTALQEDAVHDLLRSLHLSGLDHTSAAYQPPGLEAALVGGSKNKNNASFVRELLTRLKIPLIGEDLGETSKPWRAVHFYCNSSGKDGFFRPGRVDVYRYKG